MPGVALAGERAKARSGAGFLLSTSPGSCFVACSFDEYEHFAVALAARPAALARIRLQLRHDRWATAVFDTVAWTRAMERALLAAWDTFVVTGGSYRHVRLVQTDSASRRSSRESLDEL